MMFLPSSAVMPSGSLTAGVPAAQYPAGSYAFRTSILVLALDPVVDNAAFVRSLADFVSRGMSGRLRSGSISVGTAFQQAVPREDRESLASVVISTVAVAVPAAMVHPVGFVLTIASAAASSLGWAIGSAGNVLIPDQLPARWVTIDGIIDSPSGPVTTGFVTQAIASALDTTLRLRTPRAPYAIIQPRDARVGESVIARTRESGACSGHRRFDKVIAAACTRLEAVAPQPVAQQPAARPPAPQQPLQPQPVAPRPAARPPAPRPAARPPAPSPVAPPQQYRPPAEAISPWWYAVGAVAIAGAVVLITTKDSR